MLVLSITGMVIWNGYTLMTIRDMTKLKANEQSEVIQAMELLDKICATTYNVASNNGTGCFVRMHAWGWGPSFNEGRSIKRYKPNAKGKVGYGIHVYRFHRD